MHKTEHKKKGTSKNMGVSLPLFQQDPNCQSFEVTVEVHLLLHGRVIKMEPYATDVFLRCVGTNRPLAVESCSIGSYMFPLSELESHLLP